MVVLYSLTANYNTNVLAYLALLSMIVLYLLINRINDDIRDFDFDSTYYKDRQIQQGLISLQFLKRMALWSYVLFVALAMYINLNLFWMAFLPLLFAKWAKADFMLPEHFKSTYFFTYNAINMLQMLILQFALYIILVNSFDLEPLLYFHIALVFALSLLIEVTRKIKPESTPAHDQYSDRLGFKGALKLWFIISLLATWCFVLMAIKVNFNLSLLIFITTITLSLSILTPIAYSKLQSEKGEKIFWLLAIAYYVIPNLILAWHLN
jgi:hypothetical protein